jgi:hypothetical protein
METPTDAFDPVAVEAFVQPILNRAALDNAYMNDVAAKAEILLELFLQEGLLDLEVTSDGNFTYRVSDLWKRELTAEGYDLSRIPSSHLSY